ncbi:MAG: von Willebrand factor type A domain-containing protein [FCB group bacterium]|jgi:Ca-activated chloride channel family protein|nr:von Willebrand factor type A domain-containing protein [FCB group bacterium]
MTLDMEKLTAYVLGELDDAERQAVEEFIMGDEAAQEAVAELRATAAFAREALHEAQPAELAPDQRADIEAKLKVVMPRSRPRTSWLAVAAGVVVLIGATVLFLPTPSRSGESRFKIASEESSMSPAAREAERLAKGLPEGKERYLVTDHNGPPIPRSEMLNNLNYEDPSVQEQVRELARGRTDLSGDVDLNGDVEVYQSYIQAEEMWGAALRESESKSEPPRGLTNVTVGGSLQVRDTATYGLPEDLPAKSDKDGDGLADRPELGTVVSHQMAHVRINADFSEEGADAAAFNDPNKVYWPGHNTEAYDKITDNPFKDVTQEPLSTFSIDVDTASYSNVRRFLTQGTMPPPDSVRIEELLNYFDYGYAPPADKSIPFASHIEVAACPWAPEHRLARVALKGWEMAANERPASNLVFLIDVSGSMQPENKLPLLKEALRMLVRQLDERDRIAMVVYAGSSGLVLPSTPGNEQAKILGAIDQLESGGSTHGSAGIQLAYETAIQNFLPGATNRVLLCTDGDFNVGVTDAGQLTRMIEEKAKSGVFLTVLGFGMGNLKDANLEQLADKGNGNYAYIDTLNEARKVLVQGLSGTLVTIAKDVKIQIEFNPAKVQAYRLIGYENRIMAKEDFNDDTKDAGEIGAGHSVTALYELVPPGARTPGNPNVDPLKYQQPVQPKAESTSDELFTLKLRYKAPDGDTSKLLEYPARDTGGKLPQATPSFRFAAAVAQFGMLLRNSPYKGTSSYDDALVLAEYAMDKDPYGYRTEFVELVRKASALAPDPPAHSRIIRVQPMGETQPLNPQSTPEPDLRLLRKTPEE